VRNEEADPALARREDEDVEERGTEPASLHRVGHRHGKLGGVGALRQADEARDTDEHAVAIERDHGDVILAVDRREVREHRRREIREVCEKPLIPRLGGEPVERGAQRGRILGTNGSEHDGLAADDAIGPVTWSYLHGPILALACFERVSSR
jgi:hypothetical protein